MKREYIYAATVYYERIDNTHGVTITGGDTIEEAQESADHTAAYYRSIDYDVEVGFERLCKHCGGKGTTPPTRRKLGPRVICAMCRGRSPAVPINRDGSPLS